ncbi:MAG: cupin domain-containing protein [Magnetococcales bacterium]|nr:cupin domain-containing protein [Magnetococcales bacterium]
MSKKIKKFHWDTEDEMLSYMEKQGYQPERYIYPPGTYFTEHSHPFDKIAAVLGGRFRITHGDEEYELEAGDGLFIPKGTDHSAKVVGTETAVTVDAPPVPKKKKKKKKGYELNHEAKQIS